MFPRPSMTRAEEEIFLHLVDVILGPLLTTLCFTISAFSGDSVVILKGKGVCATKAQGTVSLSGLNARLFYYNRWKTATNASQQVLKSTKGIVWMRSGR